MKRLARHQARRPSKAVTRLPLLRQPRLTRRFLLLKLFAPLKLFGPYKPIGAKSYRAKGVSRLDHEKITAKPVNRLSRSTAGLTRPRNPKPRRVAVIQITVIL